MRMGMLIAGATALVCATLTAAAERAHHRVVNVAVYRGPASCEDCSEAVARAVTRLGSHYHVDFVGPAERADVTPAVLSHYRIYVQPGGGQDIDAALASLGDRRVAAIRRFVAQGGGYLGLCMGAYLAGGSSIGLVAADLDSEVKRPGFGVTTIDDAAVPVRWAGRQETLYYQDGPFLPARAGDPAYRAVATYRNGDLAAARYSSGRGLVVLSGPHPEADRSWYDDADLPAATMPTDQPVRRLLEQFDA